jgi:hypothetical protein
MPIRKKDLNLRLAGEQTGIQTATMRDLAAFLRSTGWPDMTEDPSIRPLVVKPFREETIFEEHASFEDLWLERTHFTREIEIDEEPWPVFPVDESERIDRKDDFVRVFQNESADKSVHTKAVGIKTDGLIGCFAVGGLFELKDLPLLMTHRAVDKFLDHMTVIESAASLNGLRSAPGNLFVFRREDKLMPQYKIRVDGEKLTYIQTGQRMAEVLGTMFPRCKVQILQYGDSDFLVESGYGCGIAGIDAQKRIAFTDVDKVPF